VTTENGHPYGVELRGVGRPQSTQRYYGWFSNRQIATPRVNDGYVSPIISGLVVTSFDGFPSLVIGDATGRADTIVDRTRLTTPLNTKFLPSQIPVRGQPFFGNTEESTVTGSLTQFSVNTTTDTVLGAVRTYYQNSLLNTEDGRNGFNIQHVYAQWENAVVGKTFSLFTDPDIYPDSLNQTGPNAYMDLQDSATAPTLSGKAQVRYFMPLVNKSEDYVLAAAIEQPTVDATIANLTTVARTPDFVGSFRWQYDPQTHVQLAALYRELGAESSTTNEFHQSVASWGTQLSLAAGPFGGLRWLENDVIRGAVTYGEGIAAYNVDLTGLGYDLALDAQGNLRAVPLFTYFIGYTHYWSRYLRSNAVFSQVNLDSLPSQGLSTYRRGRYAEANLIYEHTIEAAGKPAAVKLGFGVLYGDRENLSGARGDDYRILFVVQVTGKSSS
jgi:hypothetical protein